MTGAPQDHDEAFAALAAREPLFHHEAVGASREVFEAMTTSDFRQIDASGRVVGRADVIEALVERDVDSLDDGWSIDDFAVRQLGIITWLATYELTQDERVTRRSTIWTHVGGDWLAVYHQATLA